MEQTNKLFKYVALVSQGLVCLLGLIVLFGWYSHNPLIIQILPAFVPMQFNTALGFVFSALGLYQGLIGRKFSMGLCGVFLILLGILTLTEYLLTFNLGIDEFFMKHYISVNTSHPGRMAPNTALAFTLTGLTLILYLMNVSRKICIIFFSIVLSLGAAALIGYFSGLSLTYGWGKLTHMAVHTSIGFVILSVGAIGQVYYQNRDILHWYPMPTLIVLLIISLLISIALQAQSHQHFNRLLLSKSQNIKQILNAHLKQQEHALIRMARRWNTRGENEALEWKGDAMAYYEHFNNLVAIERIDSQFIARWVVPEKGNETDLELDMASRFPFLKQELVREQVTFSKSFDLIGRGRVFFAYTPLYSKKEFDGLLLAIFDVNKMFFSLMQADDNNFVILDQEGQLIFQHIKDLVYQDLKQEIFIEFNHSKWRMQFWSTEAFKLEHQNYFPLISAIFGSLISFLVYLTLHMFQLARKKADESSHQAKELQVRQKKLKQTNQQLHKQQALLEEQQELLKQLNLSLQDSQVELQQKATHLEEVSQFKSEFLANMSHELRTPLNSILILSKLMTKNKDSNLSEKQVRNLNTIYSSGSDLLVLISDVLDMAKIESGNMPIHIDSIDLAELLERIKNSFEAQIHNKGLLFKVSMSSECPQKIFSDRIRVEQILKNFLSNAIKFTSDGQIEFKIFLVLLNHFWLKRVTVPCYELL